MANGEKNAEDVFSGRIHANLKQIVQKAILEIGLFGEIVKHS